MSFVVSPMEKHTSSAERNGPYHPYRHRPAVKFARNPFRHLGEYPQCLFIERRLHSLKYGDIGDTAVDIDHKRTCNPSLYPFPVSVFRITPFLIDKAYQSAVSAGEAWFLAYKIVLVDFFI